MALAARAFSGRITTVEFDETAADRAQAQLRRRVAGSPLLSSTLFPIGDGVIFAVKN